MVIQTYYNELKQMTEVLLEKGELEDRAIVELFDSFHITSKSFPPACLVQPFVDSSKEIQVKNEGNIAEIETSSHSKFNLSKEKHM